MDIYKKRGMTVVRRCHAFHGIVLVFVLGARGVIYGGNTQTPVKLSPEQLRQDTDFLFRQLEEVHPNIRANISEERYAKIRNYVREQCGQPLTLQEFYEKMSVAIDHLGDGHTFVHPPLGSAPKEQKESAKAQFDQFLAADGVAQCSYELLQGSKVCILRYNYCGLPRELPQYQAFFAKMFAEMRNSGIRALIIDVRKNGGGFSGTNDLLLRYLARAPFRQYEKMAKRLTPQAMAFYRSFGVDYPSYLRTAYDTSCLAFDSNGVPTEKDFTVEAKFVKPVEERLRFDGPVYVLIGRGTYSSAMLFASTIRYYKRATLIGEETLIFCRARQHYGDVVFFSLPNSQLTVQTSTAIYTVTATDDNSATRIVPDYQVAPKPDVTGNEGDAVERFALSLLEEQLSK
jgi:hypothetical protein